MKQKNQKLPPGWTEEKIRAVIAHYDAQTDEEGAAEILNAPFAPGETWMSVPTELLGSINKLIQEHGKKGSRTPSRNRKKKPETKTRGDKTRGTHAKN
jgi:hypothetical protein